MHTVIRTFYEVVYFYFIIHSLKVMDYLLHVSYTYNPRELIILLSFTRQVCRAVIDEYADEVMPLPTTAADCTRIADGFRDSWNIPHTLGAIDGEHIACKCPPRSGSTYFNYKKYLTVVLLAL